MLNTRTRISADKFLICYLMLLASPFWFCMLPLFILSAPMKLVWKKEENRLIWRWVASIVLLISLGIAWSLSFCYSREVDGIIVNSFPIRYPASLIYADDPIISGWIKGLNISFITGTLMLPLTIASYIETKKRTRSVNSADI